MFLLKKLCQLPFMIIAFIIWFPAIMSDLSKGNTDFHGNKLDREGNIIYSKKQKEYIRSLSPEEQKKYTIGKEGINIKALLILVLFTSIICFF